MGIALGWMEFATIMAALLVAITIWRMLRPIPSSPTAVVGIPKQPPLAMSFHFSPDGGFVAANEAGDQFLQDVDLEVSGWMQMRAELLPRFPDLPARVSSTEAPVRSRYDAVSPADPAQIAVETHPEGITVDVYPVKNGELSLAGDAHCVLSQLGDLPILRAAYESAPNPIWLSSGDGRVLWSNTAYKALDAEIPKNALDPASELFQLPETRQTSVPDRVSIRNSETNRTYWFNVTSRPHGDAILNFAFDIQAVVKAEAAQHNFVQTLAKTFAHLATGLAVFDRNRQLVLFNPALVDLTRLPADFLIGRPNLFAFFDQLRNEQIMPEPADYASWRERIADVIAAASDGNFVETWSVSCGLTYRVTGRPHPDGAIAFLFEDISAEMSLTRKFRGEMDITQSALNALPGGIAIFSATGALLQCNDAMMREWDLPDATGDTPLNIMQVTRAWQKKCLPSPVWGDVRDCILGGPERAAWTGEAMLKTGDIVTVHVSPIASGANLITLETKPVAEQSRPARKRKTAAA